MVSSDEVTCSEVNNARTATRSRDRYHKDDMRRLHGLCLRKCEARIPKFTHQGKRQATRTTSVCFHRSKRAKSASKLSRPIRITATPRSVTGTPPLCPCVSMMVVLTDYIHYVTYITLHYSIHYITLHYVTLRYVTLRYVTLRYVTLRYVT